MSAARLRLGSSRCRCGHDSGSNTETSGQSAERGGGQESIDYLALPGEVRIGTAGASPAPRRLARLRAVASGRRATNVGDDLAEGSRTCRSQHESEPLTAGESGFGARRAGPRPTEIGPQRLLSGPVGSMIQSVRASSSGESSRGAPRPTNMSSRLRPTTSGEPAAEVPDVGCVGAAQAESHALDGVLRSPTERASGRRRPWRWAR